MTDPVPAQHDASSSIGSRRPARVGKAVHWDNLTVPAGGSVDADLHACDHGRACPSSVDAIVNDGIMVRPPSGELGTTGSPHTHADRAGPRGSPSTPASDIEGGQGWADGDLHRARDQRRATRPTAHASRTGGSWTAAVYDATCTTPHDHDAERRRRRASVDVCVKVDVPADAAEQDDRTTPRSRRRRPRTPSSRLGDADDDRGRSSTRCSSTTTPTPRSTRRRTTRPRSTPTASTTATGTSPQNPDLPQSYLTAHKNVVWFTGNSYPAPISAVRDGADGLPRRRRTAVHVRARTSSTRRPARRRSSTTTCTSTGTARRSRTTRRPATVTA